MFGVWSPQSSHFDWISGRLSCTLGPFPAGHSQCDVQLPSPRAYGDENFERDDVNLVFRRDYHCLYLSNAVLHVCEPRLYFT